MASIAPAPVTLQAKPLAPSTPAAGQSLVTQSQQQPQQTHMKITMPVVQGQQVRSILLCSGDHFSRRRRGICNAKFTRFLCNQSALAVHFVQEIKKRFFMCAIKIVTLRMRSHKVQRVLFRNVVDVLELITITCNCCR